MNFLFSLHDDIMMMQHGVQFSMQYWLFILLHCNSCKPRQRFCPVPTKQTHSLFGNTAGKQTFIKASLSAGIKSQFCKLEGTKLHSLYIVCHFSNKHVFSWSPLCSWLSKHWQETLASIPSKHFLYPALHQAHPRLSRTVTGQIQRLCWLLPVSTKLAT